MNSVLQSIRDHALEAEAQALYSDTLPYHNFAHVQDTLAAAELILVRCREENIRVDSEVVYFALLFHDAGYQDDHHAHGCKTKERYSTVLATPILRRYGVTNAQLEKTVSAILATERDGAFISAEQKAVRAADLSGLAADYPDFLRSSLKLKREFEFLHKRALDWPGWLQVSREVLGFYLTQEIRLTSYFRDDTGESTFHKSVRANLTRLLSEPREPAGLAPG